MSTKQIPKVESWSRNTDTEGLLRKNKVPFSYQELSLAKISFSREVNEARFDQRLDPELVETYVHAMQAGDRFKAVLVNLDKNGKYRVVGGSHRLQSASECKMGSTLAIVIKVYDPVLLSKIMFLDNAGHGKPPTREERYLQAMEWMREFGWTTRTAADFLSINERTLVQRLAAQDIRAWLQSEGIRTEKVPQASILKLKELMGDRPVLKELSRIIVKFGYWGAESVKEAVDRVLAGTSEEEKMDQVQLIRKEWSASHRPAKSTSSNGPVHVQYPIRKKFKTAVTNFQKQLDTHDNAKRLQLTGMEKDEDRDTYKKLRRLITTLTRIGKEMRSS